MSLIYSSKEGWIINKICLGPPFHVEEVGPYKLPQVCDRAGTVALSGPEGAVFQHSLEQANELCNYFNKIK